MTRKLPAPLPGCVPLSSMYRGCRYAQPPATIRNPSGVKTPSLSRNGIIRTYCETRGHCAKGRSGILPLFVMAKRRDAASTFPPERVVPKIAT
jgi:hypothetical protein